MVVNVMMAHLQLIQIHLIQDFVIENVKDLIVIIIGMDKEESVKLVMMHAMI
jgi:hypothetical protein